jgi:hypothetical protein
MSMEARPFTQNKGFLRRTSIELLSRIKAYRNSEDESGTSQDYEIQLRAIADVLAYAKLASIRVADIIPMRVEQSFLEPLALNISRRLWIEFLTGDDPIAKCTEFLEESRETAAIRAEMERKRRILQLAEQDLTKFQSTD